MLPEAFFLGGKRSSSMQIGGFHGEDLEPLNKRTRSLLSNEGSQMSNSFFMPHSHQNALLEHSPLGLQLKKSPSLLDLIQTRISQSEENNSCSSALGNNNTFCPGALDKVKTSSSGLLATSFSGPLAPSFSGPLATSFSGPLGTSFSGPLATSFSGPLGTSCSGALGKKDIKFKASNFTASRLRIGSWEFITKNAGTGLMIKFYFAKRKLVWEVLDGASKHKIEIHWSDIIALKADCPNMVPGTLTILLSKPPLFFKESDPVPKKHTYWHSCKDFTDGQASTHRLHFLEFPEGVLDNHYQKLIQSDTRLKLLSQKRESILDSTFFVTRTSNPVEYRKHGVNRAETARVSPISRLQNVPLRNSSQSLCSLDNIHADLSPMPDRLPYLNCGFNQSKTPSGILISDLQSLTSPSPSLITSSSDEVESPISVIGTCGTTVNSTSNIQSYQNLRNQQQLEVPVFSPADDFTGHVDHFTLEQTVSENSLSLENTSDVCFDLDELHRLLFSDTTTTLDESLLMPRVNSLSKLIELDQDPPTNRLVDSKGIQDGKLVESYPGFELIPENRVQGHDVVAQENGINVVPGHKQLRSMPRNDSYAELLHDLPWIASLPKL